MTAPAPRIRWNETSPYTKAGQFGPFSFTIVRTATEPGWLLIAELPGLGRKQARSDALDELKAEAERWLEEFVSSLDAVFPMPDTRWQALGDWLYAQVQEENAAERYAFAEGLTHEEAEHSKRASAWRTAMGKMHELESAQERTGDGEPQ